MRLEIVGNSVGKSPRLRRLIEYKIAKALRRFKGRIKKVIVRLEAAKNPRKVSDKNCTVEVDLAPGGKVLVKTSDRQIGRAVSLASKRVSRSVQKRTEKIKDLHTKGAEKQDAANQAA